MRITNHAPQPLAPQPLHYTGFWVKDAITTVACAVLLSICVSACKDSDNAPSAAPVRATPNVPAAEGFSLNNLLNSIEGAKSGVEEAVGPHAEAINERTKSEVEKLFRWEYRVVEVPTEISTADLEGKLGELGSDGWECFHMQTQASNTTRITCKRKPRSALSYLKFMPGF